MDGTAWFMSAALALGMIVLFALTFVPFYARWSAYRHSVRIRVDLPSRLERAVSSRLMARDRGASVGALAFVALATFAFQFDVADTTDSRLSSWFIVGAAFAGAGAGTAVAAFTGTRSVAPDTPRVARSGAVGVADYLAPFERIGARIVIVLSLAVAVVGTALTIAGVSDSLFPVVFFAVVGVVSLVLFEVVGRRIVDLSQPAGSTAELVWDDAVRALLLRDMVTAPLALGTYSVIFGLIGLAEGSTDPSTTVAGFVVSAIFAVALVATATYSLATRPQRYFVDRLWPNLRWSDTADVPVDAA